MGVRLKTNIQKSNEADVKKMTRRGVKGRRPKTILNAFSRENSVERFDRMPQRAWRLKVTRVAKVGRVIRVHTVKMTNVAVNSMIEKR